MAVSEDDPETPQQETQPQETQPQEAVVAREAAPPAWELCSPRRVPRRISATSSPSS